MGENDYIKIRLDDQINWYERKSALNKKCFRFCQVSQLVLATVVTLSGTINLLGYSYGDLLSPVLGALIAIIASLLGLYKYQELWIEYRTVTESLKHEKFMFLTKSEP
jgi:hypothetical protein